MKVVTAMPKKSREDLRREMPSDYMPNEPMSYAAVFLDYRDAIEALPDAQAGKLFKAVLRYADDYSRSYDASLKLDADAMKSMKDGTKGIALIVSNAVKRKADDYRLTSYGRSLGGRPPKDKET